MRALATGLLLFIGVSAQAAEPPKSPLSPEESLKHFVLGDKNLQIEIVAAEPEVIDPVAIQFDEHGRLWVVELSDYPNGPEPGKPPLSRIKLLEDKDGDGRYETAHIFADKLLFATGVQPWDGGVIVTLAGEVAYFKDTDGDHKADVRETWFTGFAQANPQLRANHPTFGPDGWIYVANGLRGGNVIAVKKDWPSRLGLRPDPSGKAQVGTESQPTEPQPVSLTGRDFKFDPLTGRYEAISGNGQFGMTFDAWGNRFVCDNRHPCRHVIFEEDFIRRCPHVAFPAVVHDVIPADDKNQVFPLTSAWTTSNLHAGTFTASCGVTVYTGDWLPEEFRGNVFVCEPTGNLVQRAILEPDGVTFKSRNPYQRSPVAPRQEQPNAPTTSANKSTPNGQSESTARSADLSRSDRATETQEFLASRDDWFRPVDLQNGPDGALYVVDMYRAVIEHPEWVPDELKKRPDTWLGNDKGRIYRIRPKTPKNNKCSFTLAELREEPLTALGDYTNGWNAATASRLAHERMLSEDRARSLSEQFKLHREDILYSLSDQGTWLSARRSSRLSEIVEPNGPVWDLVVSDWNSDGGLKRATAIAVDESKHRGVRAASAARAMQGVLKHFAAEAEELSDTANHRYMLSAIQCWQILAPNNDLKVASLADIAPSRANDRWVRQAILASVGDHATDFAQQLVRNCRDNDWFDRWFSDTDVGHPDWRGLTELFAAVGEQCGALGSRDELTAVVVDLCVAARERPRPEDSNLHPVENFDLAAAGILGVAKGLSRRRDVTFNEIRQSSRDIDSAWLILGSRAIDYSRPKARNGHSLSNESRRLAIRLLALLSQQDGVKARLQECAETEADQTLRLVSVEAFATMQNLEVDAWLVERYRSETPAIRRAILAALFASKERQLRLLEAIEQGEIAATELDPVRVNQLTQAKDETLRERAKTILAAAVPASRKEVLDAYQPALSLKGDPKRGRELFVKNCSTCHRVDNVGVNVAPDISDTRTKKPEQLLLDILDPNKAIDANYFAYAVVTKEGKTESGVISSETATSITLKQPEGKVLTLLRTDIEELRNTGLSLMPVGLEKNLDQQAMADLVFWLKNWRYLDGKVPATSLGK